MRQMPDTAAMRGAVRGRDARAPLEPAILAALVALLGTRLVGSHWTSIWMDREFTGTVAPIANRVAGGMRLYADGGHIPMPPLPFVLVRLLSRGEATWLWESVLNFTFQALTVALCWLALRRLFRPPVPFLAAMVTVPIFFALPKTVLYDSMAQAAVAALLLATVVRLGRPPGGRGLAWVPGVAGLAALSAAALLVKQSTAAGACLGVAAALLVCDRGKARERVAHAAAYAALTALFLVPLALALSPWADPAGLVRDVFLAGAEPKGGPGMLLGHLRRYASEIGRYALVALPALAAVVFLASRPRRRRGRRAAAERELPRGLVPLGAAAGCCALWAALVAGPWTPAAVLARTGILVHVLWLGLFLALVLGVRRWWPRLLRRVAGTVPARAFGGALGVTFAAAVFHSLSTYVFRWSYDNNPLVALALAALFQVVLALLARVPSRGVRLALLAAACFVIVPFRPWARLADQLQASRRCSERWDEVRYLAGARLQPSAAGMRRLVGVVRGLAAPGEEVLLLPGDPNVEAWFERPRPRLSSPFIFADQYWDRLVDADVAALAARPPRLIVIGPIGAWRGFHRQFKAGRGAERLVDRVAGELLPARYRRAGTVAIVNQGRPDAMEVWALAR